MVNIEYDGGHKLLCEFIDEVRKRVDLTPLLKYLAFEDLRDGKQFIQFSLDQTIFWKNGADIAPEYFYEHGYAIA